MFPFPGKKNPNTPTPATPSESGSCAGSEELYALRADSATKQSAAQPDSRSAKTVRKSEKKRKRQSKAQRRSCQDSIHYRAMMLEDGICEIEPGLYSASIAMHDTDYWVLSKEGKEEKFASLCAMLNGTDSDVTLQLSIISDPITDVYYSKNFAFPERDAQDQELNQILREKILEKDGGSIVAQKMLTITMAAPDIQTGRHHLKEQQKTFCKALESMQSACHPMTGPQRLFQMQHILRPGDERPVDPYLMALHRLHSKDLITPSSFDWSVDVPDGRGGYRKSPSIFRSGEHYGMVLSLHGDGYGAGTSDEFVYSITSLPFRTAISVFISPKEQTWAIPKVQQVLASMDSAKTSRIRSAAKEGIPAYLATTVGFEKEYSDVDTLYQNLTRDNQKYFSVTVLAATFADTPEEVLDQEDQIRVAVERHNFHLENVDYEGENALNSILPIGKNFVPFNRGLNTAATAMFNPFTSPELIHPHGLWFGQNKLSGNPIFVDLEQSNNGNALVLGPPGVGKSYLVKMVIKQIRSRYPDDEIMVIDPEREYGLATEALGGEVVRISPDLPNYINPWDLASIDTEAWNSQIGFILTVLQNVFKVLTDEERSIIDRAARAVYHKYFRSKKPKDKPSFQTFCAMLDEYKDEISYPIAQRLKTKVEMLTTGTLSIFGHETNVNLDKPIVDLDIKDLTGEHRKLAIVITLNLIWQRLSENRKRKIRTWIFVEEYQSLMTDEYTATFFKSVWSRARKYGGYPFAITQNVEMLLATAESTTMVSNSEFVVMLKQAYNDKVHLQQILNLSDDQAEYIQNVPPGNGLIKWGSNIIPFDMTWPDTGSELYKMFTTKPKEMQVE